MKKETKIIIIGICVTLLALVLAIFLLYIFYEKGNAPVEENNEATMKEENTNSTTNNLETENKVIIYLFHGSECPACNNALAKIKENFDKFEQYEIKTIEIWHNKENIKLLTTVEEKLNIEVTGVPFFLIGNYSLTGYYEQTILEKAKEMTSNKDYQDIIDNILEENKDISPTIETLKND